MGAKQSKRSVDISGKEAEGAGEVVAAGGEGRVEQLADVDTLKPQLNGDAPHIQTPDDKTEKEKQLENGTPENEKDATTEKEAKEKVQEVKETETPVTNGESEHKENGENEETTTPAATPEQESGKKPKKVKKKWSLRSISFSRKDKPKQEKKPKEEEPKANGDPEKVPEEAAEPVVEVTENKVVAESNGEVKDEKTPETPVTEPLTNGSSAPESPKVETPPTEEAPVAPVVTEKAPEEPPKPEVEPEQLPLNGLSLEEEKKDFPEAETKVESQESKIEDPVAVTTDSAPAPEIPVKSEEPVLVAEKILDVVVPEVADVPPSKPVTLQETSTDVAVSN